MTRWRRGRPVLVLLVAGMLVPFVLAQKTDRAKQVGRRLMCQCGCGQILSECNHLGCWSLTEMGQKLDARVAAGESDQQILDGFVKEYGLKGLSEPPKSGFGLIAWVMPWVAVLGGLGIVWIVLQRMRNVGLPMKPAASAPAVSSDALARFREQADRESDGG